MQTLMELIPTYCVVIVAAVSLLARLGAPFPAGPVLLVVGALAGQPGISAPQAFLASIIGSALGDAAWFVAGRRYGYATLVLLCKVSQTPNVCVSQNESSFDKWGARSLIAGKFLPGISVVAPPMAGALGMRWSTFLLYEVAGGALYSGLFLGLGYVFKAQVQAALGVVTAFGAAALGGFALALAICAWIRYRRRRLAGLTADVERISVAELLSLQTTPLPPQLIDVRASVRQAVDGRSLPGALHMAINEFPANQHLLARGRDIVAYCSCIDDATSARACRKLSKQGFSRVMALHGGLQAWMDAGLPTVTP